MLVVAIVIGGLAVLSHTAPAPFLFEAFRPSKSLWRVAPSPGQPPALYLTFDDGPNAAWTPALLDALAETGATATFFLIPDHITPETEPIVRRIVQDGHAIGIHSGTRRLMIKRPADLAAHLKSVADRIETISGRPPCRLFRPHAGWRSSSMYEGLEMAGYRLTGWSWGMWDWDWWRQPRGDRIASKLSKKASAGDIIVIHDGHHKNPRAERRHAAEAVRHLVPVVRANGLSFAKLCD